MRASMFILLTVVLLLGGCGTGSGTPAPPASDENTAEAVIAVVRNGLERLRTGDPSGITNACSEDVTYYSVEQDSLLVGRQALVELYGPPTGQTAYDHFDMINPQVRVYGDGKVAVLAFDFASYTTADDSQLRTRWRSTQVLTRSDTGWQIVHIHWTLLENRLE